MQLPDIFKNEVNEHIKNSREIFYGRDIEIKEDYPYYAVIQTKTQTFKQKIIGKTANYLVTSDGKMVYLKDCLDIKKID